MYKLLFENLLFILLSIYLEEKLLGHIVTLRLTFWVTAKLCSKTPTLFYISISNAWEIQCLHILSTRFCSSFNFNYAIGIKRYHNGVWICTSLMTSDAEHIFMSLLFICISPLKKCLLFHLHCHFLVWL